MIWCVDAWRLVSRPGHPDFLDLPWSQRLTAWAPDLTVEVVRGTHRHVVKFVAAGDGVYALKELPGRLALREYRLLREMDEAEIPVVEAVGVVERPRLDDVLITRYLDFSLPYRLVFTHGRDLDDPDGLASKLLDGMALLLARLHLAGFFWGDCSLNNTLFRRDAGMLAAYLVDAETSERHPGLTDGQRSTDLELTEVNVVGGLLDVAAELELEFNFDPVDAADGLRRRYDDLWKELTAVDEIAADERWQLEGRIRRLNDLGFDVSEIEVVSTAAGRRLRLRPMVAEQGHHRRQLLSLTGLEAQENQARSLLNDLANFRAWLEGVEGRTMPRTVATYRWLSEVFEPTVARVPKELYGKREAAEVFHEIIQHKWFLSEHAGHDVGIEEATQDYLTHVLPAVEDEKLVLTDAEPSGFMGYG